MIERDPPFISATSQQLFIDFENSLHALLEFISVSAASVDKEVARRKDEFEQTMKEGRRWQREDQDFLFDPVAAEDYYPIWIAVAEEEYLPFVYMGGIALLFSHFEAFLEDLAAEAAELAGTDERLGSKPPVVERALAFMRHSCAMVIPLSNEHEQQLWDVRKVRHKLIHELGGGIPAEVEARIGQLLPAGEFSIDMPFVEHGFDVVAAIASLLEEAFAKRFGLDASA